MAALPSDLPGKKSDIMNEGSFFLEGGIHFTLCLAVQSHQLPPTAV